MRYLRIKKSENDENYYRVRNKKGDYLGDIHLKRRKWVFEQDNPGMYGEIRWYSDCLGELSEFMSNLTLGVK